MGPFWLVTAAVIGANGLVFRARAERYGAESPNLKDGYVRLANGFMAWLIPPTLLIALGVFAGWSTKFAALPGKPSSSTPFDRFCQLTMLAILLRSVVWVFVQDGAQFLAAHRRVFQPAALPGSSLGVKVAWALMSALFVISWYFQFVSNRP